MSNHENNPVGALQERFQSRGVTPQYRLVQAEGASHAPTFAFQVILGDLTATGTGSSKKQAKHAAAQALLGKLDGFWRNCTDGLPPITDKANGPDAPGNTVGALPEFCIKKDAGRETDSEGSRTLWVGGINPNVDKEILFELFLNSGPLEKVTIPKDQHTLKQKSFAFIVFEHTESVEYAIKQMSGVKLFGRRIRPQRYMNNGISNEVNDNYLGVPNVANNNVTKIQTTNIKIDFLRSGQTESANNCCFANEKFIDLKECDESGLELPQKLTRRNGIKVNLITLDKSKKITELDNDATDENLQSSQSEDFQFMKAVSNELEVKNANIVENIGSDEPGAWTENIISPQKCSLSPEKLGPYLNNDDETEWSRDREFPENEISPRRSTQREECRLLKRKHGREAERDQSKYKKMKTSPSLYTILEKKQNKLSIKQIGQDFN